MASSLLLVDLGQFSVHEVLTYVGYIQYAISLSGLEEKGQFYVLYAPASLSVFYILSLPLLQEQG